MTSIKWIVAITCLVIVKATPDDPGPQIFEENSPATPLNSPRGYVMKEVTLYLTPSQIKALEAGKGGQDLPQQSDVQRYSEHDLQKLEAEIKRQLERQHIYINDQSDIQRPVSNLQNILPPQVEEHVNENPPEHLSEYQQKWKPMPNIQVDQKYFAPFQETNYQNPNKKFPESYSFVKIYTDEKVHETPKLQLFHPIPYQHENNDELSKLFEVRRDPLHGKQYKLIPYEYLPDNSPGAPKPEEVKELTKWVTELDQYENPYHEEHKNQGEQLRQSSLHYHKDESYLKYAPNFDEQKHSAEYQKFVINLEKENALSRAEAILKAPTRKDVVTKRRPIAGNVRHGSYPYLSPEKSPVHRHVWKY